MGVLRRASKLVLLAAAVVAVARPALADERRVRLVPPLEGPDVTVVAVDRDGTRRLLSRGLRVVESASGEVSVSDELLPSEKNVSSVELPARFGGGYLFAATAAGRTSLWKATTWAGSLHPFADVDFEVGRIVPGFDRLHVQAGRLGEWAALDAVTGKGLDRGSLPKAPRYGAMAFVDAWFGAVEMPVRGTVVSFDAGASWHPLAREASSLGVFQGALVIGSGRETELLGADGRFRPAPVRNARAGDDREPARIAREGSLGRFPLRTAVLRGIPDGEGNALVVSRGALAKVRLSDGRVLREGARVVNRMSECTGVRVGKGFGFVCGEARGNTEVYGFQAPFSLSLRDRFAGPRVIASAENGALVVSGRCEGTSDAARDEGVYCVIAVSGARRELASTKGGLERVIALQDGRTVFLEPPSSNGPGSLRVVDAAGRSSEKPLALAAGGEGTNTLLKAGFWMHGMVEISPGVLSGWVVSRGSFLGVRVGLDGRVTTGSLRSSIENALVSGRYALVVGVSGIAEQTSDGGFGWADAAIPAHVEARPADRAESATTELEQGCSAVGCVFRRWLRVGWDTAGSPRPLRSPPRPEPTVLPSPGGGRWGLTCHATGEASAPSLAAFPQRRTSGEGAPPWLPFLDVAAPTLAADHTGVDFGVESELVPFRAYLDGPPLGLAKSGTFQLRVADRYRVESTVWSTSRSASPWSDFEQALDAFGYDGSSPSGWRLALDPAGNAGILSVTWRGSVDHFVVEEDRPIRRVQKSPPGTQLGVVTSAVRAGATFYVSSLGDNRTLRVFALDGGVGAGAPRLIGEYRDVEPNNAVTPVLVRATGGARAARAVRPSLGLWVRGAGWYVFPIDERTGATRPAIELSARALANVPRVCTEDEEGYVLEGPLGLEPSFEWSSRGGALRARAVEGRFVASTEGLCVSELAAQADGSLHARAAPFARGVGTGVLPLTLSDRGDRGRRLGFRCQSR